MGWSSYACHVPELRPAGAGNTCCHLRPGTSVFQRGIPRRLISHVQSLTTMLGEAASARSHRCVSVRDEWKVLGACNSLQRAQAGGVKGGTVRDLSWP